MKQKEIRGEITVFLSLIFVLLVSFIGNMIASANIQAGKNQRRAILDRSVYSLFGEYQKDLLEEYELFAIEGGFETGSFKEDTLLSHLDEYGADSLTSEITGIQYLTDNEGQPFMEQVVTYMRDYSGIEMASNLIDSSKGWSDQEIEGEKSEGEMSDTEEKLQQELEEHNSALPENDNPIQTISNMRKSPLLALVMPKDKKLSTKSISLETVASHRSLQKGRGTFQKKNNADGALANLLFGEYLLSKFQNASSEDVSENALSYETEYFIAGKDSDEKNLESVARQIMLIRMGINRLYLQTDIQKQSEAEAMAATLASLAALPVVTEVVKQAILAAWAYGESIMDLRTLLSGQKAAIVKSHDTWQLSLEDLVKLGTAETVQEQKTQEDGISYVDYLRILLFLRERNKCAMRAIDLIEQNLQQTNQYFRSDFCITGLQLQSRTVFERGISYDFPTYFAYR